MATIEELTEKYNKYTVYELVDAYQHREEYSSEGQSAIEIVIRNNGGIEHLISLIEKEHLIESERERIQIEVYEILRNDQFNSSFINSVKTEYLSKVEIQKLIDKTINNYEAEVKDKIVKPRTIIGGIIGGLLGGTISGILWGLQIIYSGKIFFTLGIGLAMFCYFSVKFFTKQSYNNVAVIIFAIISCIYALYLGQFLYFIFGYRGP